MAINLLKFVQEKLGLGDIKKVDPNTQQVNTDDETVREHRLTHATLTGVLTGLYNLARSEEGLHSIATMNGNFPTQIFAGKAPEVLARIGDYANRPEDVVRSRFDKISAESLAVIREQTAGPDETKKIRELVSSQRDFILPYLPAELQLGQLLDDNTLDDRTNKMEGPVSSLINKIAKGFSGSETPEEAQAKKDKNY
ncbi:MAG: hypothetical protein JWQ27_1693 [Ferruginibacter sp.]|nr:hypothetical protein [Ferruginibacter sp.]